MFSREGFRVQGGFSGFIGNTHARVCDRRCDRRCDSDRSDLHDQDTDQEELEGRALLLSILTANGQSLNMMAWSATFTPALSLAFCRIMNSQRGQCGPTHWPWGVEVPKRCSCHVGACSVQMGHSVEA